MWLFKSLDLRGFFLFAGCKRRVEYKVNEGVCQRYLLSQTIRLLIDLWSFRIDWSPFLDKVNNVIKPFQEFLFRLIGKFFVFDVFFVIRTKLRNKRFHQTHLRIRHRFLQGYFFVMFAAYGWCFSAIQVGDEHHTFFDLICNNFFGVFHLSFLYLKKWLKVNINN